MVEYGWLVPFRKTRRSVSAVGSMNCAMRLAFASFLFDLVMAEYHFTRSGHHGLEV